MSAIAVERPPCITGEQQYRADSRAPGDARRHVRALLGLWRLGHLADVVQLVASELVTNAVQYGGGGVVTLRMSRTDTAVIVRVWDANPRPPVPVAVAELDESGRGLPLVWACSGNAGWCPERGGKTVWAEVMR